MMCDQLGPASRTWVFVSLGSNGAMSGESRQAPNKTTITRLKSGSRGLRLQNRPAAWRRDSSGRTRTMGAASLLALPCATAIADPRVCRGIGNVDQQVSDRVADRHDENDRLDDRIVLV